MMGLTNTSQPDKVHKADISIGKNYLSEDEINMLKLIGSQADVYAGLDRKAEARFDSQ